jgi:excisionase family DNA binding protein
MTNNMLSVSEAAKLMHVCENTLRDWDIEGKFVATRTPGGHRRYTLEQVIAYLEVNPAKEPAEKLMPYPNRLDKYVKCWSGTEYFVGVETDMEKRVLSVLLENMKLQNDSTSDSVFSTNQVLWLTREVWLRLRFRKMVSVQPLLLAPCGLVYYFEKNKIQSEAVCAKISKFYSVFYGNASFDQVKHIYAEALAKEIDIEIFRNLSATDIFKLLDSTASAVVPMKELFDYIIAPYETIEILKGRKSFEGVDLFGVSTLLDETTFCPRAVGGRYPTSYLTLPIFSPYILFFAGPTMICDIKSVMMRSGWFVG